MSNSEQNKGQQTGQSPAQPVYYMAPPQMDEDEINLLDYWRVLVQYRKMIVMVSFLATAIAVAAALMMTEVYRAEVMVVPADEDTAAGGLAGLASQFGGLASLAGVNIGASGGKSEEAQAILLSRKFTAEFIKENNLMPVLFEDMWDDKAKKWLVESKEDVPTDWDAYKVFNEIRDVSADAKTGMISLSIEWSDPELAAELANKLIKKLNQNRKEAAIIEAEKSMRYLEKELETTSVVDMRQSLFQLIEAQAQTKMLANVRDEFAFKVIDPAVVPEERVKPKRKLMVVLGGMVGLMLGVFLAFFLSFIKKQKEQLSLEGEQ